MLNAQSVPDPLAPHLSLFNTQAFYGLRGLEWQPLELFAGGSPVGTLVTHSLDVGYVSGRYAPYGGVDWYQDRMPPETVDAALAAVPFVTAPSITIKCAPTHRSAAQAVTLVALHRLGFRAKSVDLSYWIPLPASVETYVSALKRAARVALTKTERYETVILTDDAQWALAFELLQRNRADKGRRLSFDLDYLLRMRGVFGECVEMLGTVDREAGWLAAAALVYRVSRGHAYVQWWGGEPGLNPSPMNVLARDVVAHSIATGAVALDLGVSSNDGVPDAGLCRFKRSVGAVPEAKWTLAR